MEHQVPSIQILHHKEQMLLKCRRLSRPLLLLLNDNNKARLHLQQDIYWLLCKRHCNTWKDLNMCSTLVWKVQCRCVRNGLSQARASTRFSTMVHSTSSSINTTSFFRAFTANHSPLFFNSAKKTWKRHRTLSEKIWIEGKKKQIFWKRNEIISVKRERCIKTESEV